MYTITGSGPTTTRMPSATERYVDMDASEFAMTRPPTSERICAEDATASAIRNATRSMDRKLCVIVALVCLFVLCNLATLLIAGVAIAKYEQVVNVYVQNLTSPEKPDAPFSAPRLNRASMKLEDMLSVAHVASQILSNETTSSEDSNAPRDPGVEMRRKGLEARLERLNDTMAAAERMALFASGPHVSDLMDVTANFVQDTMSQIDMDAVNTLIATIGNSEYVNHTLGLADKAMGKVDSYEHAMHRMAVLATQAWLQRQRAEAYERKHETGSVLTNNDILFDLDA
ncbi:hypothetical protein CYMTET_3860 [Cymbomonas tetramitiformis]|uniref:Transmembrane protein n=1 Tax=Cymbomonas tetramitiformis TaxID=36881 RepID=A0AAE0GYG8_9CHLO|nr:hypothetical protein CYMTET_6687 [Cymbomonas tetramitiformis]KAK3288642.1 hypothetical protein CYMTET_3860 [Cymbomonas tetramitiformis]